MDFESVLQHVGGMLPVGGEGEFSPVNEGFFAVLEKREDQPFPTLYKEFLLRFGACTPGQSAYFQPQQPLPKSVSKSGRCLVDVFYGGLLWDGSDDYSLCVRFKFFSPKIGPGFVPIADDGGGSQLCLCTSGDHVGAIYFWDSEHKRLKGPSASGEQETTWQDLPSRHLYYLADSFSELIQGLRPLSVSI